MDVSPPHIRVIDSDQPQHIFLTQPGEYVIELAATGAAVEIKGGWHTTQQENISINLRIIHRAKHTRSNTLLRGVATDQSHLTLSGTIEIRPEAVDTNAFLTENILLLSDQATAQAIPNLEIQTNEVRCSHAATVTRIPPEHLFYLGTRGLTQPQAQNLIIDSFLGETKKTNSL